VYIEVDSDGFGNCENSTLYTPWDFVIQCKTCVTQAATYEVVGVCESNQEFYVDVNLTDLGSADNISMTDGVATQTTQSTGVYTFGPYEANSDAIITITNVDDVSCSINSGDLTFLCPPAPNECSIIYAGEDTEFCEGTSTNLTAVYHPLGQDTTSYDVTTQQACPTPPLTGGIPTSLEIDDRWSEAIDLGFEFCFFGGTYSQLLIGSNGVLSFELDNADGYNGYSLDTDDTLPNSTNTSLSQANIFGVAHDIDPSVCGSINYMVLGSSPSRQFVVNFSELCHFSCNDIQSSSQIILYESSNTIDINIYDKPTCTTWNGGLAVVGVQNIDDTIAFTPPERNTSVWEATDEFWRFTPSLGTDNYVFEWFEGTTLLGTNDTVTVSPTETTTYTASITYNLCTGGTATVTDTVVVEINPTPQPMAASAIVYQCPGGESVLEVTVDADIADTTTFYWSYNGVDVQSGPENTYLVPTGQFGDYLVTAIDDAGCYGDTVITVTESTVPELEEGTSFTKCMNEDVELGVTVLNQDLIGDDLEYTWYIDGNVVQSGSDDYYTHTAAQENGMITVVVTDIVSSCESATTIEVEYYMNTNCVDMPQGLSPNGDGMNDCLELDHLEDKEDIVKIEIFNRYGVKVFEMNDYVNQWCGQNASDGNDGSNELLPVGTYFYVVQFASGKEPNISWIYLNY
jgi:gliding motility-associated-like protein